MAKNRGRVENLRTPTTEQAREIGRRGGIKSAAVKKERKLLSQIYADMLAGNFEVETPDGKENLPGDEYLRRVASNILARGDSASVSMLKEVREATEGAHVTLDTGLNVSVSFNPEGV